MDLLKELYSHNLIKVGTYGVNKDNLGIKFNVNMDFVNLPKHDEVCKTVVDGLVQIIKECTTGKHINFICSVSESEYLGNLVSEIMGVNNNTDLDDPKIRGKTCIVIKDIIQIGRYSAQLIDQLKKVNVNILAVVCIANCKNFPTIQSIPVKSLLEYANIKDYYLYKDLDETVARLRMISHNKSSRLIVRASGQTYSELCNIMQHVGHLVCGLILHSNVIDKFPREPKKPDILCVLAQKYGFLMIEDRRLYNDPGIMLKELNKIKSWADMITIHCCENKTINKMSEICDKSHPRFLLLSQPESFGDEYTKKTYEIAKDNSNIVIGFVCSGKPEPDNYKFIHISQAKFDAESCNEKIKSGIDFVSLDIDQIFDPNPKLMIQRMTNLKQDIWK